MTDRTHAIPHRKVQPVILVLGYLAVAHFSIGLCITIWLFVSVDVPVVEYWFTLPYIGIAGIFVVSLVLGHLCRLRWSAAALILGLLVSMAAFAFDFRNNRYQMTGGGTGAKFTIWWWYYEPFWYGYEPGNV